MENKNKSWFVKTQDENTAKALMAAGFDLVDYTNDTWTFLNDSERPLTFDNKKVAYSNMLCI